LTRPGEKRKQHHYQRKIKETLPEQNKKELELVKKVRNNQDAVAKVISDYEAARSKNAKMDYESFSKQFKNAKQLHDETKELIGKLWRRMEENQFNSEVQPLESKMLGMKNLLALYGDEADRHIAEDQSTQDLRHLGLDEQTLSSELVIGDYEQLEIGKFGIVEKVLGSLINNDWFKLGKIDKKNNEYRIPIIMPSNTGVLTLVLHSPEKPASGMSGIPSSPSGTVPTGPSAGMPGIRDTFKQPSTVCKVVKMESETQDGHTEYDTPEEILTTMKILISNISLHQQ
jgi:hypothetical protein